MMILKEDLPLDTTYQFIQQEITLTKIFQGKTKNSPKRIFSIVVHIRGTKSRYKSEIYKKFYLYENICDVYSNNLTKLMNHQH